jgi:energy-coupling factor transport system substrate-specific component
MKSKKYQQLVELIVFAMLGVIMFISKYLTELLPNIHFLGMLTMTYTIVYRKKALVPLYVFVMLMGIFNGFSLWWIPYLYIWTILWAITMLLPKKMSKKVAIPVYAVVCALHGLCYGILYAPAQAIMFGLNFKGMLTWIASGFYFDLLHGIGNFALGFLIVPLTEALQKFHKTAGKKIE